MAYFNHAFKKTYVCSGVDIQSPYDMIGGLLQTNGVNSSELSVRNEAASTGLGIPGVLGFFGKDYQSMESPENCCALMLIGASLKGNDKQGSHGGYRESNKSKVINPKYVSKFYDQPARLGNQALVVVGNATPADEKACADEFICGETYYLRIDIKGTSPLRFAHHNIYHTVDAYAGCCDDPSNPAPITDPALIYGQWAQAIADSPYLKDFVMPILVGKDAGGQDYGFYATAEQAILDGNPGAALISEYLAGSLPITLVTAGIQLLGAYEDTVFGDCTFQPSDHFSKNPLQIFASEVDLNGDPCEFAGVCITDVCKGLMSEGLGEQVLRDLILSESYMQNFLATDLRIREITQGTSIVDIIDRSRLYHKAYLLHSVPRFNNPSGTFDNDQYLIEVAFPSKATLTVADDGSDLGEQGTEAFDVFKQKIEKWLLGCGNECTSVSTKTEFECARPSFDTVPSPAAGPANKKPKV
jgi:hypothetical protein